MVTMITEPLLENVLLSALPQPRLKVPLNRQRLLPTVLNVDPHVGTGVAVAVGLRVLVGLRVGVGVRVAVGGVPTGRRRLRAAVERVVHRLDEVADAHLTITATVAAALTRGGCRRPPQRRERDH